MPRRLPSTLVETLLDLLELILPIPIIIISANSYRTGYCSVNGDYWKSHAGVYIMCFFVLFISAITIAAMLLMLCARAFCRCSRSKSRVAFSIFKMLIDVFFASVWAALATAMFRHVHHVDNVGATNFSSNSQWNTVNGLAFATMSVFAIDVIHAAVRDAFYPNE